MPEQKLYQHIYLDMDGVLCDFVAGALRVHHRLDLLEDWPAGEYDIAAILGISADEFWKPIHAQEEVFWQQLEPCPWLRELVALCEELGPVSILTRPSESPHSALGKLLWVQDHLPTFWERVIITREPKALLSRHRTVLVDDSDRNCVEFDAAGLGQSLVFPQPWNSCHHFAGEGRARTVHTILRNRMYCNAHQGMESLPDDTKPTLRAILQYAKAGKEAVECL